MPRSTPLNLALLAFVGFAPPPPAMAISLKEFGDSVLALGKPVRAMVDPTGAYGLFEDRVWGFLRATQICQSLAQYLRSDP